MKVSSPVSITMSLYPGIATEFSWLRRPMPQILRVSPDLTSCATTTPIWREVAPPIGAGHWVPVLLTQSTPSSLVNRIGRSKPSFLVGR